MLCFLNPEQNSERKQKKIEQKRTERRKVRKAMTLDDKKFYQKELRGLSAYQKRKLLRQRKNLIEKEKKKANSKLNKDIDRATNKEELGKGVKPLIRNPRLNGKPSTLNKKPKVSKFSGVSNPDLKEDNDEGRIDVNGRLKLLSRIKSKKRKEKRKQQRKVVVAIVGLPTILVSILIGLLISLFVFSGVISSILLSHPKAIKDLYDMGVLGNALYIANVADDVKNDAGEVIAYGKEGATPGQFVWNGEGISAGSGSNTDTKPTDDSSGTSGAVPADKKAFMKMQVSNDFKIDEDKMNTTVVTYSVKAKSRLGGSKENVKKVSAIVKANGMAPELFWAYELQEQGDYWGWLNHTSVNGNPYQDADSVSKWAVSQAKQTGAVQLAWYDVAFPYYTTPANKQAEGQAFANALPSGALGRMYLSGTAAATWGAFDPDALKASVNKVQDYGDPIKGVMDMLNTWKK